MRRKRTFENLFKIIIIFNFSWFNDAHRSRSSTENTEFCMLFSVYKYKEYVSMGFFFCLKIIFVLNQKIQFPS